MRDEHTAMPKEWLGTQERNIAVVIVTALVGAVIKWLQGFFERRKEQRLIASQIIPSDPAGEKLRDMVEETRTEIRAQTLLRDDQHAANIRQFADIRSELRSLRDELRKRDDRQSSRLKDFLDELRETLSPQKDAPH